MRDLLLKCRVAAGPSWTGQHALYGGTSTPAIYLSRPRARSAARSPSPLSLPLLAAELCSLVSWILTPETPRKKGAQKEGTVECKGGVRGGGRRRKREKTVEISRRHHSLPPRRLSVSPPFLWPYKTAFHPHSWWRQRDEMRPAESHAGAEPSRRDSQDRALIEEHELREKERAKGEGENRNAFFGRARARRHYSHEDRKHRGARREGWDPWIIARSYFSFLYIVLYLGGGGRRAHIRRTGCYARPDTALTRARKTGKLKEATNTSYFARPTVYLYLYNQLHFYLISHIASHIFN